MPRPQGQVTLRACFADIASAVAAVSELLARRVMPATIELVDRASLEAVARHLGERLAPEGTGALLLIEVDGGPAAIAEEADVVGAACRDAGAVEVLRADATGRPRGAVAGASRDLLLAQDDRAAEDQPRRRRAPRPHSPALRRRRRTAPRLGLTVACFGHAGDGNIHVNIMVDPDDAPAVARARQAERALFEEVVALEGSIRGEHGIGFSKAPFLASNSHPTRLR